MLDADARKWRLFDFDAMPPDDARALAICVRVKMTMTPISMLISKRERFRI